MCLLFLFILLLLFSFFCSFSKTIAFEGEGFSLVCLCSILSNKGNDPFFFFLVCCYVVYYFLKDLVILLAMLICQKLDLLLEISVYMTNINPHSRMAVWQSSEFVNWT